MSKEKIRGYLNTFLLYSFNPDTHTYTHCEEHWGPKNIGPH